jgi:predicted GNAT family N-acyltransferase
MELNNFSVKELETYLENKYNSKIDLSDYKNGDIYLAKIVVDKEKRGEGTGSKIMNEIIDYADIKKRRIILTPSTDYGASSVSRLKDFYKTFGFIENKGKNKDFSIRELMYRKPKFEQGGTINNNNFNYTIGGL